MKAAAVTLLRKANVVDTRSGEILAETDVLIEGGKIAQIAAGLDVPAGAVVVDASGKYIVPGYNDMHAHPLARGTDPSATLELMLAFGITGYRQMSGTMELLRERREGTLTFPAASPALLGMPGPLLTPMNAATQEQAVATVREQAEAGADFFKCAIMSAPQFMAAQAEAVRLGVPIVGHLPSGVDVEEVSRIGMHSIEHFGSGLGLFACCSSDEEEIEKSVAAQPAVSIPSIKVPHFLDKPVDKVMSKVIAKIVLNPVNMNKPEGIEILDHAVETFDEEATRKIAERFVEDGTWNVPTLIRQKTSKLADDPQFPADPDMRFVAASTRKAWDSSVEKFGKFTAEQRATFAQSHEREYTLARIFDEAGVKMMVGTDSSGAVWVIPGAALHDEIDLLAQAGIAPLKLLQMLTLLPAEFLGREDSMGSVAQGINADLVILDADPVSDVASLHRISGVVRDGKYYGKAELAAMKDRIAAARAID